MTEQLTRLEQILGGKLERKGERQIPGTVATEGTEVVYFSDDRKNKPRKQFTILTNYTNPPNAKTGGASESGCNIYLPNGQLFHAISYHGDIDGWRKDIEVGAQALHLVLGRIDGNMFVVSDGRVCPLIDCRIEFC